MKILLTGAAGFIGARTAEMLIEAGHQVVGIDNLNNYYDISLKRYRLSKVENSEGFSFYEVDIEDKKSLDEYFKKYDFDAVVNMAARAGVRASLRNPFVYLSTNTLGTLNILDLMVKYDVSRFVMASTSSLYAGKAMPFLESADVRQPLSPYAASKLGAEAMSYSYHRLYNLHVSILRYFTVYGPAGRPDMSPFRFTEWVNRGEKIKLYGTGKQTRDFTFIDDIARGTIAGTERCSGYEIYNIGGGNSPISINCMIGEIEKHLGKKAIINYQPSSEADMQDTAACIDKAEEILDWHPEVDPIEGLRLTAQWHIENRDWLSKVEL